MNRQTLHKIIAKIARQKFAFILLAAAVPVCTASVRAAISESPILSGASSRCHARHGHEPARLRQKPRCRHGRE